MQTREATAVFFGPMHGQGVPVFVCHQVESSREISATPFQSMANPDVNLVYNVLKGLYKKHREQHEPAAKTTSDEHIKKPAVQRDQWINQKRAHIATVLKNQQTTNYAAVARSTNCSYKMIKRVHRDLLENDEPENYQYTTRSPLQRWRS